MTQVAFSAIANLRTSLVATWHEVVRKVSASTFNIKTRKYNRGHTLLTECPLDINLMPLPSVMVAFPKLR